MKKQAPKNETNKLELQSAQNSSSIAMYTTEDGTLQLDVKLENETVWLSQEQMSLLFNRDRTVIGRHIRNAYEEGEVDRNITCAKFAHMGMDGDQTYETILYNLDVIISVGYRVKSINGVHFRRWATDVLKSYLVKGYAVSQKITQNRYEELKSVVRLMSRTYSLQEQLSNDEADGKLEPRPDSRFHKRIIPEV